MCGIAGFITPAGPEQREARLQAMLDLMRMRGPDGEGSRIVEQQRWTIALGHRRLAILDLTDAAAQPMTRDGVSVVFNGEIYNFLELRGELETLGHRFASRGDTEVLLAAYRQWGEACLDRLNGMFAFAILDSGQRRLFCARDRAGERPFYYYLDREHFVFASEVKSVMAFGPPVPRAPNRDRVVEYLTKGYQPMGESTYFEGIRELLPAHKLAVPLGDVLSAQPKRYWSFPEPASDGPPLTADELTGLLDDAVRIRLRSDVPIGTCLSGGMDSPSVAAAVVSLARDSAAAEFRYQGVHAYSPVPEADERTYVERLARDLSIEVNLVEVTGHGLRDELDELVFRQEYPFLDPSIYAQRCVFRRAAELGLKVMLDGQGSDELLGGYDWAVPRAIAAFAAGRGWVDATRQIRSFAGPRFPLVRLAMQTAARCLPNGHHEFPNALDQALRASFVRLGLPTLLRQGDRNALAFGVEVRLPFLDHRLVEATARLRPEDVARDGHTKVLLRRAMQNRLPRELLERKDKFAFSVPQARWICGELRQSVREAAGDRLWKELDFSGTKRLLRDALAETNGSPYRRIAWKVLCLTRWHRRFFGQDRCVN
jgi:asparagine synthase (glutamine-hydrolysing)